MALFGNLQRSVGKEHDKKVLAQIKAKKEPTPTIKKGNSILSIINTIKDVVEKNLGHLKNDYLILRTREELHNYFSLCKDNNLISIDTETEGLDPIMDKIAGLCIYTPNQKAAYVPINHKNYITKERVDNQLTEQECKEEFEYLLSSEIAIENVNSHKLEIIMFNATFDMRFIRNQIGFKHIYCTWDCSLASRLLNENEPQKNLKVLHNKYCLNGKGDAFRFDDLFNGVLFTEVPITTGYIYAAHDAIITYELYKYQKPFLTKTDRVCIDKGLCDVADVFHNIEMQIVPVVCDMEDIGVDFDTDYNSTLSEKYGAILKDKEDELAKAFAEYDDMVARWRVSSDGKSSVSGTKTKSDQLDSPINFSSPTQLAIFFYDVLGCESVDTKSPRGTGEDILIKLKDKYDLSICKLILDYRSLDKLIGTYIDKLPNCVCPKDGRIHCKFNQYGADCITGDSPLLTNSGYVYMQDLFDSNMVSGEFIEDTISIVNRDLKFEDSSHKIMFKSTPTIKLHLRGGYEIEGTPNHPIICSRIRKSDLMRNRSTKQLQRLKDSEEYRQLDNITTDNIVAIPIGYNIFPNEYQRLSLSVDKKGYKDNLLLPTICDENFAELLGMYFADGSYKDTNGSFAIYIHNKDTDVEHRVRYLVKTLFNLDCTTASSRYSTSIVFRSIALSGLCKYLGRGARNKCIPDIILKSPKSVVCAFIRGMTLDSSFDERRTRLTLNCVDSKSFKFIQSALLNMGIVSSYRNGLYDKGVDHCGNIVDELPVKRLMITGEMYKLFLDEIGVIQSSKMCILDTYTKSHFLIHNNTYYAYVNKIEVGVNDVYDLHIPETHSFIANGVINHNTGRFSSSNPNLQNIPSHNTDIRKMFKATDGYVLMSSDYSQQEPKVMTQMCHDPEMLQAYLDGKDLYSQIASVSFHRAYRDCLEFVVDDNLKPVLDEKGNKITNKEGKSYRSQAKSILLGILYGRGDDSVAEQLGCSVDEAKQIKASVFNGFPAIAKFEQDSLAMARELGYVTTLWGRKRRLPDMQLPDYSFEYINPSMSFDPLDFENEDVIDDIPETLKNQYTFQLNNAKGYKARDKIIDNAKKQGIKIISNTKKKGDAQRQCVNARIQGSAADLSKLAMMLVGNDKQMKEWGFRLLIPVHDELIGECPRQYAKECSERLAFLMAEAAKGKLEMPIKSDVTVTYCWYGEEIEL